MFLDTYDGDFATELVLDFAFLDGFRSFLLDDGEELLDTHGFGRRSFSQSRIKRMSKMSQRDQIIVFKWEGFNRRVCDADLTDGCSKVTNDGGGMVRKAFGETRPPTNDAPFRDDHFNGLHFSCPDPAPSPGCEVIGTKY